jgi:hypothetical protein
LGLNRKKFECISTKDKLFAINTSKNTFFALLFTLSASGQLFGGLIEGFTSQDKLGADFFIVFSILFIVGLIGFRQFLWLINGRQEMIIENGKLTLYKKGIFWTTPKVYLLDKVNNIREGVGEDKLSLFDRMQHNIKRHDKVISRQLSGKFYLTIMGKQ